jgi:hypothetical protein
MQELLSLIQGLPRPLKYLAGAVLFIPLGYFFIRLLGLEKYWWLFLLGMLVVLAAVFLFEHLRKGREKQRGEAFEGELRKDSQAAGASKEEVREALKDLSVKWMEAVRNLKAAGLDIYSLPWYLLIGEPQSGKSTTLKNSGLEFPVGGDALSGAGGTRNCDWWFANEAVILDTAGRFTFQEEAAPDASEWSSFLKLLRKYRAYCPINGVLVVIPATSLLEDTPEEQDKKAQNIRQKLIHIQRLLDIRFPIFFLITKADRALGFSEFFTKLDPVEQRQLFGWSNPAGAEKPYDPAVVDAAWDQIVTRVHKLRLKFLSGEENIANADRFIVFPEELRALKEPVRRYLDAILTQSRYDEPFVFRGFYISSGVQQGKPIAQATRDLLKGPSGSAGDVIESLENIFKKSRAFFIKDFYEKKVFPEQGLVAKTRAAADRERKTTLVFRILTWAILPLVVVTMIPAFVSLRRILNPIRTHAAQAGTCMKGPCSIAQKYELTRLLYEDRVGLTQHPILLGLFLRGAKSNEIHRLIATIQQKLFFDGVVRPLLKESEARMAALNWETFADYAAFSGAFQSFLAWRGFDQSVKRADGTDAFRPEDLRLLGLVNFAQKSKGVAGSEHTSEIDEWVAQITPADPRPDQFVTQLARGRNPGDLRVGVPDPTRSVDTFERYWTVANLARWDWKLMKGLEEWVRLYTALTGIVDPQQAGYLKRAADAAKQFKANFDALSKHLETPRPGEKGFPGANVEQWQRYLNESYAQLLAAGPPAAPAPAASAAAAPGTATGSAAPPPLAAPLPPSLPGGTIAPTFHPAAQTRVNTSRLQELIGRLQVDYANLGAQKSGFAFLLDETSTPGRTKFSNGTVLVSGLLAEVGAYSDLEAFRASDDGKILTQVDTISSLDGKKQKLEEWQKRQEDLKNASVAKAPDFEKTVPDGRFRWSDVGPFARRTAELALLARVLPPVQEFLTKSIGPGCNPAICFQKPFTQMMIPYGNGVVSLAERQTNALSRDDAKSDVKALSQGEIDYLQRFLDATGAPARSAGGGFSIPGSALTARAWHTFQIAVGTWTPAGGGGGGGAPDQAGQLSLADLQGFVNTNGNLNPVIGYYKSRFEARVSARPAVIPDYLLAAAETFKRTVGALGDKNELKSWKQLATGAEGATLRGWHAFTGDLRIKGGPYGRTLKSLEDRGASLIKTAVEPQFNPRWEALYQRLASCCSGQFPFIPESRLKQERADYAAERVTGGLSLRRNLPTIGQADVIGVLTEVGVLSDEYAIDPLLGGAEPSFDFILQNRGSLAVARLWQRFISGASSAAAASLAGRPGGTGGREVSVLALDREPGAGRRPLKDRVSQITLFDRGVILRPSTDIKSQRIPPPFVWRLSSADALLTISGRNEQSGEGGWTSTYEVTGGPLKFFYFVELASERRTELSDPKVWIIRVQIPDGKNPRELLEGAFELRLDEPLPPILPN